MKKLFYVVSALAALTLLAPNVGFAQSADNQLGIYGDEAGSLNSQNFVVAASTPFTAYMVLTNPVDNYDMAVAEVEAFECRVAFSNGAMVAGALDLRPGASVDLTRAVGEGLFTAPGDYVITYTTATSTSRVAVRVTP